MVLILNLDNSKILFSEYFFKKPYMPLYELIFFTLLSITGVCLIIWFSSKDEIITKILSTKLFVGIGLISYSLYLWHYPVFAFVRITELALENITVKILIIPIILFTAL